MKRSMRKSLREFAYNQEVVLKGNDYRGGWENCQPMWLWERALQEMMELRDAIKGSAAKGPGDPSEIMHECCDVANFMMMISDNQGGEIC